MVRVGKNLVVIGGKEPGPEAAEPSVSLYKLSCINNSCDWKEMEQVMNKGRYKFVAMAVPANFFT